MPDAGASEGHGGLLKLMAWLSPAFPVGSFAYSHGLERAVHDGLVADGDELRGWIETLLTRGSGWNDAVLLAESHRRSFEGLDLGDAAALGEALAGSAERHRETMLQGAAFLEAAAAWTDGLPDRLPYCVAVGAAAGRLGVPCEASVAAFLQGLASNLLQAGIRLGVLGQREAGAILAGLEATNLDVAALAAASTLDDLGSATILSDIAAMNHETQYSRLFRS